MLKWLSRESLPSGLSLWWVCKALMGKFNASFRKSTETALGKVAWSPTTFTLWKWSGERPSFPELHTTTTCLTEYVCKKRKKKKNPGFTNCLKFSQSKKEQPSGHLSSPQLYLQIFTLILKASITQTNVASQWQHCQGRIITATADWELLLRFTTSSPSSFCLAEFLALTASSGNKFYQWATSCIKKHLTWSRPVAF